ncbi:alpha/beta family hydrolase [Trinickia sp. Y13]|jgi:dienelactone hydrolase|uniref:dienelactone hydrolase family protein n=1 Tax=Trinickia sp. Y13 TaxID=2917807 RepID=UPI00240584E0|nr:alpha/beta family hydrolase [Trinickia sp. Y13]MDG0025410.1 dienelactone hydrolase family protein [Trinickia sp. Y13]
MRTTEMTISSDFVALQGLVCVPDGARGIVVFAHGSGSSRLSPRNQEVASILQRAGLATLLFDLLTADEHAHDAVSAEYRFNIPLLGRRLSGALDWLLTQPALAPLSIGLFGASTGAAAALCAAAERPAQVRAVVSRGGRPDLAREALPLVKAPTLLIVGELDTEVIRLNRLAAAHLACEHELVIVPGATHLFEEPGKLDETARLAAEWFSRWLV